MLPFDGDAAQYGRERSVALTAVWIVSSYSAASETRNAFYVSSNIATVLKYLVGRTELRGRFRCFLQSMRVPSSAMPGRMFSLFPLYTEMLAW